ncbi:MAG: YicC/YloC family endoribonuclease [Christensenellales bacterium]
MRSMTGFGRGESENSTHKVTVDIKSVNGKFLDINVKMGKNFLSVEEDIKNIIKAKQTRGTIDVFVSVLDKGVSAPTLVINFDLAKEIYNESAKISSQLNIPNNISAKDLLKFDDVMEIDTNSIEIESISKLIKLATEVAVNNMSVMQETEGKKMQADLKDKINKISNVVEKIKSFAPEAIEEFRNKLKQRISEALVDTPLDMNRFLNEVAYYVDKTDINEEIVRLHSHINQFNKLILDTEPVGKRLEFLTQEITREINTTGSKVSNINLTTLVLEAKNINETIKEQIRNVE